MTELNDRLKELLRRTKITTKCRYRASERLERHHKFSQWVVALCSVALVFIPLLQALNVSAGIDFVYLNASQAVLAVLVLVYSLLLGQENFISRSQAMHRNGVELGRLARTIAGKVGYVSDEEYEALCGQYYDVLDKYENHKPVDYLQSLIADGWGDRWRERLLYLTRALRFLVVWFIGYSHYFVILGFVGYIFYAVCRGIIEHGR